MMSCIEGDLPKSHKKLTSTAIKYMKKHTKNVAIPTAVFMYHGFPL